MRHLRNVGSALGVLALAAACASFGTMPANTRYRSTSAGIFEGAARDSLIAQSIADREGPRVSIRAVFTNVDNTRHVRANFDLEDDAYVVVGHLDPDGVVRIVFPADPRDDGFVTGSKSYQTNEFFAGFSDEYRWRARDRSLIRNSAASRDSYDGGLGYVFIIASWRPMRTDQFSNGNKWDTFEVADRDYLRDPRPAINELAALLAGDNREAYTVQYARYFNTIASTSPFDGGGFGSEFCSGYSPVGFAISPFSAGGANYGAYGAYANYGSNILYRGQYFYYDRLGDCYRPGGYAGFGYGYGYGFGGRIAQGPTPPPPVKPRAFDPEGRHTPPTPPLRHKPEMPVNGADAGPGSGSAVQQPAQVSPEYRRRGLITAEDRNTGPARAQSRIEMSSPIENHARRSIQDMINRHGQSATEGSAPTRMRMPGTDGYARQGGSEQTQLHAGQGSNGGGDSRTYSRPSPAERTQSPSPRSEPAHMSPPPAVQHSSPAPAPAAPAPHPSGTGKPHGQ